MPAAIPFIALGVSAVGTGYSIYAGERAAGQQKKQLRAEKQQANLAQAKQQRDAIRAARLSAAQTSIAAENGNVSSSSSAQGGQGSIISQLGSNLSFLDQYKTLSDQASDAQGKAISWASSSQMAGAAASLGWAAYGNSDALGKSWNKIFK